MRTSLGRDVLIASEANIAGLFGVVVRADVAEWGDTIIEVAAEGGSIGGIGGIGDRPPDFRDPRAERGRTGGAGGARE